jgi:hypothetical protein|tara:strand:+ start:7258 stop:7374 length:117 start_codon:yes stop_codon:yes gene_type:complete
MNNEGFWLVFPHNRRALGALFVFVRNLVISYIFIKLEE